MSDLRKLLIAALGLTVPMALVACDVDDEEGGGDGGGSLVCDDAGNCVPETDGGAGGAGGEGGGAGEPHTWIYIVDESEVENMAGTPGTDICGHTVTCPGRSVTQVGPPVFVAGNGGICSGSGVPVAGCSTARNAPAAALDNGLSCEADSNPSDYISVGVGGTLAIPYDGDLRGCEISVISFRGRDDEPYSVYVSPSESGDPNILVASSEAGESTSGTVSAE